MPTASVCDTRPEPAPAALPRAIGGNAALPTLAAAGLTILLFGLTPITTRIAALQIDWLTIGVFRPVGAGIMVIPILLVLRLPVPQRFSHWGLLLLSSLGGFVGFPLLFSMGAQRTSACHAALIVAGMPLFTSLIGLAAERRRPDPQWVLGAAVAFAGEASLMAGTKSHVLSAAGASSTMGDALVLISCLSVGAAFVAGARLTPHIGAWAATFWAIAVASVTLAPIAVIKASAIAWTGLTVSSSLALLHLTLCTGVVGWVSWFWALARGGIARIAVLQFFQPAVSLVLATLLLGEKVTAPILLAAAAILVGVAVARGSQSAQ